MLYMSDKLNINIFLLCYNESALLPHTIKHYKKYLPSCVITIYDNKSTDNSVEIAESLGCNIISYNSNHCLDDYKHVAIKDNCWKHIDNGWVITADMDEFLCITEEELIDETNKGTTILQTKGLNMVGDSDTIDLTDIDLQDIKKYKRQPREDKSLCFKRSDITEMRYGLGAHECRPLGNIKYSSKTYLNKHMSVLGLKFFINKMCERHKRNKLGIACHYKNDINVITKEYEGFFNSKESL